MDSESLLNHINELHKDIIINSELITDVPTIEVKPEHWVEVCSSLKKDVKTNLHSISNYGAVDYREKLGGFQLVLTIFSHKHKHRVTVKTLVPAQGDEEPEIDTVTTVWLSADWFEREIIELFGVKFKGHPDPRHLMLDDDWDEGFPLRRGWTGTDFIVKPEM
ncbi:MAG: hypothetical protein GF315_04485 [candidate division Zixibacteria bacterium]|nr:hypothetical protein [candidate division Zixibacteria bacterium]